MEVSDSREEVDSCKREVGRGQHPPKISGGGWGARRLAQQWLTERVYRHLGDKSEYIHKGLSRWEWADPP